MSLLYFREPEREIFLAVCHPLVPHYSHHIIRKDNGKIAQSGIQLFYTFYANYKKGLGLDMVAYTFNPSAWETKAGGRKCKGISRHSDSPNTTFSWSHFTGLWGLSLFSKEEGCFVLQSQDQYNINSGCTVNGELHERTVWPFSVDRDLKGHPS